MFIKGKTYSRRELHKKYGGQQQGGISTPIKFPIIMIFTGPQGNEFGYRDSWTDDCVFLYTGEGQRGDMTFIRGNRAIRDHIQNGKELHLFKSDESGKIQYIDNMVYVGHEIVRRPDVDNNMRNAIVFHLIPIDNFNVSI